ncbi:hypothetical protein BH09MYX1_BH09MYX1_63860 [soil metagenome]
MGCRRAGDLDSGGARGRRVGRRVNAARERQRLSLRHFSSPSPFPPSAVLSRFAPRSPKFRRCTLAPDPAGERQRLSLRHFSFRTSALTDARVASLYPLAALLLTISTFLRRDATMIMTPALDRRRGPRVAACARRRGRRWARRRARAIDQATNEFRQATKVSKRGRGRGRTTTAEEQALAARIEKALHAAGVKTAKVKAVASLPGKEANLRIEGVPIGARAKSRRRCSQSRLSRPSGPHRASSTPRRYAPRLRVGPTSNALFIHFSRCRPAENASTVAFRDGLQAPRSFAHAPLTLTRARSNEMVARRTL